MQFIPTNILCSETIFGSRISRKCFSPLAFATSSFVYTLHCDCIRADFVSFVCTVGMIDPSSVCILFVSYQTVIIFIYFSKEKGTEKS